ncbi:hypothetical protein OIU79_004963 [Salix purpurea]|uniref:Uncharacterized protein n=1 Tax=Salix purpurea TaxID=77065 RepID=A0A9Q0UBL4_SALPP|nr:hypothetical protein OIU79_004963 [Salix purpurea]KAJ6726934.1 hypothetical protein OIU79_004963 [Salix purpurea]
MLLLTSSVLGVDQLWVGNMRLHMKRVRSTRKENLCLSGLSCLVLMEAIIGRILNTTTLVEVMQTMFDHLPCRFIFVHSPLLIIFLFQLSKLRRTELLVWTAVNQLSIIDSKHGLLILINPISSFVRQFM